MKKRLAILLIIIALISAPISALAGRPTPQPYPAPGGGFEAQAYPPPEVTPTPGPFFPSAPSDDCNYGPTPCAYGWFEGRWWVLIDGLDFGWTGIICFTSAGGGSYCLELYPHGYANGKTFYETEIFRKCSPTGWYIYYAILGGVTAEIRQPNRYPIICIYLPAIRA